MSGRSLPRCLIHASAWWCRSTGGVWSSVISCGDGYASWHVPGSSQCSHPPTSSSGPCRTPTGSASTRSPPRWSRCGNGCSRWLPGSNLPLPLPRGAASERHECHRQRPCWPATHPADTGVSGSTLAATATGVSLLSLVLRLRDRGDRAPRGSPRGLAGCTPYTPLSPFPPGWI